MGRKLFGELSEEPCPRCLALANEGQLRLEMVQRLQIGGAAPVARDGSGKCCLDCASADGLLSFMGVGQYLNFVMARIAVGNDRQEQYRLPGAPMGLVQQGLGRPSKAGDLDDQHEWLERMNWFDIKTEGSDEHDD